MIDPNFPIMALDDLSWYAHTQNSRVDLVDPLLSMRKNGHPTWGMSQSPHMLESQTGQLSDLLFASNLGSGKHDSG